jgi:hypothetical protein
MQRQLLGLLPDDLQGPLRQLVSIVVDQDKTATPPPSHVGMHGRVCRRLHRNLRGKMRRQLRGHVRDQLYWHLLGRLCRSGSYIVNSESGWG